MNKTWSDAKHTLANTTWHTEPTNACLQELETSSAGLTQQQAKKRNIIYGPNHLPTPKKTGQLLRFLMQFHHVLIYVLLAAALITILLQHFIDTAVILAVVIINALIGFIQEGKAEKSMDAIRHMLAPVATVLRQGIRQSIAAKLLVPGDIVILEAGDKVPADLRLLKTHGLIVQESILTGESVPVEKSIHPVPLDTALGDRACMAFSGTLVTHGQGEGLVIATGAQTEIGRISGLLTDVKTLTTPLVTQMKKFAQWISVFILGMAFLLLNYGYFIKHHVFSELFMLVVSLSVAAIPEGLPAVLTITLAVGVQTMARRNTIVRRLPSIETLGSVSVIGTDKTGTLTKNEMMVVSVVTHAQHFTVTGQGYAPEGEIKLKQQTIPHSTYPILTEIARASTLCNDAELQKTHNTWHVEGDPMEGALLAFATKAGLSKQEAQNIWRCTDRIPFDAKHCFMATLQHNHTHQAVIFIKGAPEKILAQCQQQKTAHGTLEALNKAYWSEHIEAIAAKGQRVLAFAMKPVSPNHTVLEFSDVEEGLVFLGIVGLIDPPRPEVAMAIAQCDTAGIQVKMFTGDHVATAIAIGHQIGIKNPNNVLVGTELEHMDEHVLNDALSKTNIFARTTPEQKLRLITQLQAQGKIVAMTGDGVNDAPALKRADVGVAMGQKGSDVAKESSDLVLMDDNFTSIVAAIREGRTVYDNLKKVISWTLPTNAGEVLIIMIALFFNMALPISPIQILWINLVTASTLGIALAFETTEANTMRRPPRPRHKPLLTGTLAWHCLLVSMLFTCAALGLYTYAINRGYSVELARTITLNSVVVMEMFHLFFIRNIYGTSLTWKAVRGNKAVWSAVSIIVIAQFVLTYARLPQAIFHTQAIPVFDGLLIIITGILFFMLIELEKQIRLRLILKNTSSKTEF